MLEGFRRTTHKQWTKSNIIQIKIHAKYDTSYSLKINKIT